MFIDHATLPHTEFASFLQREAETHVFCQSKYQGSYSFYLAENLNPMFICKWQEQQMAILFSPVHCMGNCHACTPLPGCCHHGRPTPEWLSMHTMYILSSFLQYTNLCDPGQVPVSFPWKIGKSEITEQSLVLGKHSLYCFHFSGSSSLTVSSYYGFVPTFDILRPGQNE